MMDQTHIGYTYWQQPEKNVMPEVEYITASAVQAANVKAGNTNMDKANSSTKNKTGQNMFIETNGYVSIEAEHFTRAIATPSIKWQVIPNLGRTLSAVTPFPVTAASQKPGGNSPALTYTISLKDTGTVKVHVYLSPTLNFHGEGLRYAISIDDELPQTINMHSGYSEALWSKWVAENIIIKVSEHRINKAGQHVLKFWMVDPGVVLQKIVVDAGGLKPSYLGPEETMLK
jgi:hypothetical protein